MIITDIKQLREIPVGEVATLIMQIKPEKITQDCEDHCEGCVLEHSGCIFCIAKERPDKEEVKFVKV